MKTVALTLTVAFFLSCAAAVVYRVIETVMKLQ